jgi:transposase
VPGAQTYDPVRDLPPDHLARLVEQVVEATVVPPQRTRRRGQPPYDPRLCVKVLVYGYATGVRSSRQLERPCRESLPYLLLTRGDTPSYHTLCTARTEQGAFLEAVWEGLFAVAAAVGLERLGKLVVDSTKLRADARPAAVLTRDEFGAVRAELERILSEAAQVDAREAQAGHPGRTTLGKTVPHEQMRDIRRRVRRQRRQAGPPPEETGGAAPTGTAGGDGADPPQENAPPPAASAGAAPAREGPAGAPPPPEAAPMSAKMRQRVAAGLQAIREAEADGRKHLCLTDPEARLMAGGRERRIQECYSFEVAVDEGLLVVGQSTQETTDNARLEPVVAAAQAHEPGGVTAVAGDCGYYAGDAVGRLLVAGLDLCVPDPQTAADLHRGLPIGTTQARTRGTVPFVDAPAEDVYRCPEDNILVPTQQRQHYGQRVTVYRAQAPCRPCPLAAVCLTQANAKHRTLQVGQYQEWLKAARQRFAEPEHQERYRHRGEAVETVFGFLRGTLGYVRWLLRGQEKVASEARLFKTAYQFRKVHCAWAAG